jgi:hypothetical protein
MNTYKLTLLKHMTFETEVLVKANSEEEARADMESEIQCGDCKQDLELLHSIQNGKLPKDWHLDDWGESYVSQFPDFVLEPEGAAPEQGSR